MIHFWLIPRGEVCWDGGVSGNIFFSYKRRVYQVISLPMLLPVFCLWTWSLEETLWGAISILLQPWGDRGRDLELLNQCQPYLWIPCYVRIKNPIGRVFCYLKPKVVLCVISSTGYLQGPVLRHQGNKRPIGGASLVAQWLRICLPIQGTPVRTLVREDPTCRGATKPVHHNY